MNDKQLLRYSRHIMLPQLEIDGQQKLIDAKALIIGLGGLGSPVSMYLAAAGVGKVVLCDHDTVDETNLQRQIVHSSQSVGQSKVLSASDRLQQLNPDINITTLDYQLDDAGLLEQATQADVVLDCTDNLETRFAINKACVVSKTPLVSAAAIRWEGQISVYDARQDDSPCYHCFYGGAGEVSQTCSTNGVVGPLLGVLGSMQALEAIKVLSGAGRSMVGRVLLYDGLNTEWTEMKLAKHPQCSVCG